MSVLKFVDDGAPARPNRMARASVAVLVMTVLGAAMGGEAVEFCGMRSGDMRGDSGVLLFRNLQFQSLFPVTGGSVLDQVMVPALEFVVFVAKGYVEGVNVYRVRA